MCTENDFTLHKMTLKNHKMDELVFQVDKNMYIVL